MFSKTFQAALTFKPGFAAGPKHIYIRASEPSPSFGGWQDSGWVWAGGFTAVSSTPKVTVSPAEGTVLSVPGRPRTWGWIE